MYISSHFNPRSPHGERPPPTPAATLPAIISIHAPRTGSDARCLLHGHRARAISIHAPRTGSDVVWHPQPCESYISIHAPRTGSDEVFLCLEIGSRFQSTLPARGATRWTTLSISPRRRFQSTLPARGATLRRLAVASCPAKFQSTLPARGATRTEINHIGLTCISIHAPRTGSDLAGSGHDQFLTDFNPRSPHGERQAEMDGAERADYFNPRSPHGERHGVNCRNAALDEISIHAPRTGSDRSYSGACALRTNFNPRSPHGERPARTSQQPN